jgi:hypothetical protein
MARGARAVLPPVERDQTKPRKGNAVNSTKKYDKSSSTEHVHLSKEENAMSAPNLHDTLSVLEHLEKTGQISRESKQLIMNVCEAAEIIDPETAKVKFVVAPLGYGTFPKLHGDDCISAFARSPESEIWVHWDELPYQVATALFEKYKENEPALRDPRSCWVSFCHSRFWKDDVQIGENVIAYARMRLYGFDFDDGKLLLN